MMWLGPDGRVRSEVPESVKADWAEDLDALNKDHDQIASTLRTQRKRLARLLRTQRLTPGASWVPNFGEHPIVGPLSESLIWVVDGQPACRKAQGLVDLDDRPVGVKPPSQVTLWHLASDARDIVRVWQAKTQKSGISPLFKQADREVYHYLADTESSNKSTRFAERSLDGKIL